MRLFDFMFPVNQLHSMWHLDKAIETELNISHNNRIEMHNVDYSVYAQCVVCVVCVRARDS